MDRDFGLVEYILQSLPWRFKHNKKMEKIMKKIMLTVALLGAATAQAAYNKTISYNNSNGDGFMSEGSMGFQQPTRLGTQQTGPLPTSPISQGIIKAIKMVDPKNPVNVAKAHALKTTALNAVSRTEGILAPETQSKLTQWINSFRTPETLFIIGRFLQAVLHRVERYSKEYRMGKTLFRKPMKQNTPTLTGTNAGNSQNIQQYQRLNSNNVIHNEEPTTQLTQRQTQTSMNKIQNTQQQAEQ